MKQKTTVKMASMLLLALPATVIADYIDDGTGPTGHYYEYAVFTNSNSAFQRGYDVDSYEDLIYVNRDGTNLDVYQVALLDSDGDGVLQPDQHPNNIGGDETLGTSDDQIGPMEERTLTYLRTYSIPEMVPGATGELYAAADRVYFLGDDEGDIYQYVFATGITSKVVDSPVFNLSHLGYDDVNHVWYASRESERTVYSWNGTAWVPCFTYQRLADGGHMDGLEVILDCNNTPYVYVSDMTSDYIGQWKYDSDTASWKEENLFAYSDTSGSHVEGMGFGAFKHIWMTSGSSLYELGGGKLGDYFCGDFSVDDGGECIPSNSTSITYTANYKNKASIDIEGVQVAHTGGTWGGTSLNWTIGDVASQKTGSTTMTVPLSPPLIPNTTFSNQFTATSTTSGVPKQTTPVETLVCANTEPVAQCKDITVALDGNGTVSIAASAVDGGSFDPDGDKISLNVSQTAFNCSNIGPNSVTLTVTDDKGASDACTAVVTVQDKTAPTVLTKNITVQLDASGKAFINPSDIDNGTSDACGIASVAALPVNFTCSNIGANTVTLAATDKSGNSGSATATVTVVDTLAPTNVQANAPATIAPPDAPISFKATATDNCSTAVKITDYFCYKVKKDGSQQSKMKSCVVNVSGDTLTVTNSGGVGDNIVWTVLATDQSGNTATAKGGVLVVNPGNARGKGNNGVGNGQDPQPPGNPPVNDGAGTSPGNPGNKKKK